ncbi:UDP-phosphate N-acetylgalactosaminyl-1-phosphate transferase [Bacillus sp. AFS001701]|jgi:exopolysaccharide biosynthesis polyprenyl glycosylphosphotransferase|uniref:sugar transferase n=1 Tax=Bacillaceae TaxID=186817 RepID=UPI000BF400FE|nr:MULTISPECIES: exopolysaccharide biosynthesis polyprenyl glycosylphosphotransferase [unclassified Bacillus (in: firmicutes)]PET50973.1 UDP-phosphate N-acetylgalactosaminyl-1-phosphate transferase [Bacillus sp. AFS001701]PGM59079.1 UDP-phosphate N-acetylgalactosaminyl-1-phosphate transferase [Bacillus sp. AFS053548]
MALQNTQQKVESRYSIQQLESLKKKSIFYSFIKRTLDVVFASLAFVISLPFVLFFIALIKIDSPGPALFIQERVGLNGKIFNIYKLRTMRMDAEINGPQWASTDDPRITKLGHFLRKTRIDELPQFVNVLRGDMSLVGPRPERAFFLVKFNHEVPGFTNRLTVKPGLTGWAQVNGGYELTPKEKLVLDLHYIEHRSIMLDIRIMFKTIKVVLTGEGAR